MMAENFFQVIFQSSLISAKTSLLYRVLLYPFVALKQSIQFVYEFLLLMVRNRMKGRRYDDGVFGILIFLFLAIIATLTFLFVKYDQLFFIVFLIIWAIDLFFASYQYKNKLQKVFISLKKRKNDLLYTRIQNHEKKYQEIPFTFRDIIQLSIQSSEILGGAFQSRVATIWQLILEVRGIERLILFENKNIDRVFQEAQSLTRILENVPIRFIYSEGCTVYAQQPIDLREGITCWKKCFHTIKIHRRIFSKNQNQTTEWLITADWNFVSFWRSLIKIFDSLMSALGVI
ncbi:MAG: hypothetical protein SFW36_06325, partial [Leptolyngbyaceae cyanobacterium bins.59]|nr:hypothetical protein [Leptolyngbyaceae cyanobacterium bins.59]